MNRHTLLKIRELAKVHMKHGSLNHDFNHVERVSQNAVKIIRLTKLNQTIDQNLVQAICLLHDIHANKLNPVTYFFETRILKRLLPPLLFPLNLHPYDQRILLKAIYNHPLSYPFRRLNRKNDYYSQILQDADTLDLLNPKRIRSLTQAKRFVISQKLYHILLSTHQTILHKSLGFFLNFPEITNHINHFDIFTLDDLNIEPSTAEETTSYTPQPLPHPSESAYAKALYDSHQ